ncbi:Gfo/Idh/MocA family protein [Paenibacillus sp. strain BS8-2]
MLRIGKISYWHVHAWDYTKQTQEHPDTVIAAVWDEDEQRGREAADKLDVPFYADLNEMLASDIDAVIVDAPTNRHAEVMLAAAAAGKHIFTEKVIAPTLVEVNQILEAVQSNELKLTVSLPRLNDGYTLAIRELLEKETLGQITQVRVRLSHGGAIANWLPEHFYNLEQCAGGALIDLGCHPMYLTRLFLGELPTEVSAQFGYVTGREVEDNAVAILRGAGGAIGIVEAGFVNPHSPFTIEIHGTKGSLLYGTPESLLLVRSNDDEAWASVTIPANRSSAFEQWVEHIQNGTTAEENIALARELTILMEAAGRSAAQGRSVKLNELEG